MIAIVILILVVVVMGRGGYEPWSALALEIGAAGCAIAIVFLSRFPSSDRKKLLEEHLAWKDLPWSLRHPFWSRLTLSGTGRRTHQSDVEILTPGTIMPRRHTLLFGTPLQRTGLGAPLCVLTLWIGLSVIPFEGCVLELLSPEAHALRSEVAPFTTDAARRAPMSLVPFLTLRALWLWLAYLVFFYAGFWISTRGDGVRRLTSGLIIFGALLAARGLVSSLVGWRHFLGDRIAEVQLRAVASFGNPNHYAAFLCMIFFCGLGALIASRRDSESGNSRSRSLRRPRASSLRVRDQEDLAKTIIIGLALVLIALGILFSLSRSAIAFTIPTTALFFVLTRRGDGSPSKAVLGIVMLATLALAAWMGVGPVFDRFERLSESLETDSSRLQVAVDTLPAAGDFWITGAGLGSYRYITAQYRSFPGRVFYSWAHNDYLQLLVELGVPGLVVLLWAMAHIVPLGRRARERLAPHPASAHLHAGYICAASVIAFHSFTDFSLHLPANFMLLAIVLGVVVGMEPAAPTRSADSPRHCRSQPQRFHH